MVTSMVWSKEGCFLDTTHRGLGTTVIYATKPTKNQIRRQQQAIYKLKEFDSSVTYSIKKGKFI